MCKYELKSEMGGGGLCLRSIGDVALFAWTPHTTGPPAGCYVYHASHSVLKPWTVNDYGLIDKLILMFLSLAFLNCMLLYYVLLNIVKY